MNRGYFDEQIMNLPNPVLGQPYTDDAVFQRPPVATLAPIFEPQTTAVTIPQVAAAAAYRQPTIVVAAAPPANHVSWILPATLALLLLVWFAGVVFKRRAQ